MEKYKYEKLLEQIVDRAEGRSLDGEIELAFRYKRALERLNLRVEPR